MSATSVDVLSQLFESIQIDSTSLGLCNLRHPWGIAFPGGSPAILHAVTSGVAHFEFHDGSAFVLEPGDVLLTNRLIGGAMMSRPGVPLVELQRIWAERGFVHWAPGRSPPSPNLLKLGGRGPRTILMGVMFDVREPWRSSLLMKLPPFIHLKRNESGLAPWLEPALSALVEENARDPQGYGAIARRLAEVVLFSSLRSYLAGHKMEADLRWFSALTDRRITHALDAIRKSPERAWTLGALAREAGMSRSTFAARFHEVIGVSPVKHLRDVRMKHAAEGLATGDLTVKEAARRTGYTSSSAFSVAFKRRFGEPPQNYGRARGT